MSSGWDEMKRAKEDSYFEEENKRALERLKASRAGKKRMSPVNGKPMKEVTYMGVNIDVCEESGGVWLDPGELEQLMNAARKEESGKTLLSKLFGK